MLQSYLMLNRTARAEQFIIQPFVHSLSNHLDASSGLRKILIPDVCPSDVLLAQDRPSSFSLIAGDFLEIYGKDDEKEKWDVVVTCFFIDTV